MATDVKVDRVGEHVFKWRSDSLKSASGGKTNTVLEWSKMSNPDGAQGGP